MEPATTPPNSEEVPEVPPEIQAKIREYLGPEGFDTYRRRVAAALHEHGWRPKPVEPRAQ